jgi:hypothetical protein
VFEQRGMLGEAIDLLEANVHAGERNGEIFRWLAQLYREQGDKTRSFEALVEAAKYQPPPATAEGSALRDRPTGSPPAGWTCRMLVLALGVLIGLGILLGLALWWMTFLLRP